MRTSAFENLDLGNGSRASSLQSFRKLKRTIQVVYILLSFAEVEIKLENCALYSDFSFDCTEKVERVRNLHDTGTGRVEPCGNVLLDGRNEYKESGTRLHCYRKCWIFCFRHLCILFRICLMYHVLIIF